MLLQVNLTQTANNTPNGQHALVLKIEDANGDTADGCLSATANQIYLIGPEPANDSIKSNLFNWTYELHAYLVYL